MSLKKFLFCSILLSIALQCTQYCNQFVVIIDPAGDAQKTGRIIDNNSFEKGLTLQCAEKIKARVEQTVPYAKVILTRLPGDTLQPLHSASLANRMNADLFISLNFYHTTESKPVLSLYQFSYGNDFAPHYDGLFFHPYESAYKINKSSTDILVNQWQKQLDNTQYKNIFTLHQPQALPLKPLIGIIAPSIALEIGIKNKNCVDQFITPIAQCIVATIHTSVGISTSQEHQEHQENS